MRFKTILSVLVVALLAVAVTFVPVRGQETPQQVFMNTLKSGPLAQGVGVQQIGEVSTLSAAVASATRAEVVAAPSSGSTYLRALVIEKATNNTGSVTVSYGTGTNCGTGTTTIVAFTATTSGPQLPVGRIDLGIQVPATKALCLTTDASTTSARVLAQ